MRFVTLLVASLLMVSGCETLNLSKTVAGGECGEVVYGFNIVFMNAPLFGFDLAAERKCDPGDEGKTEDD